MSKLKLPLLFFIITIFIYFLLLFFNNKTILSIELKTPNNSILDPKVYYKTKGDFSENHTLTPYKIENSIYSFKIPKNIYINQIRIDPTTKSNKNITLKNIELKKSNWFREHTYKLDLNYKRVNQIKILNKSNNYIKFITTQSDPWILLDFKLKKIYSKFNYIALFNALFISSIITILIIIYRNYEFNEKLIAKLILYSLFFFFIIFKAYYYKDKINFGYPPDESVHFKYVEYVDKHKSIVPKFENMPHYLAHPPIYYEMVSLAYNDKVSKKDNIENVRSLSIYIYLFAILLLVYFGFTSKLSILGDFVYLAFISSIPMHSYLGGSITNDNLAILAGAIALFAIKRLIEKEFNFTTYLILAVAIFIAFFAKLTTALLLFFALIYYLIYLFITKQSLKITKKDILILAIFLIPIIYYQISIILNYHSITPTYNVTHPKEFLKSGFYIPPEARLHLTPIEWAQRMLHYIQGGWFGIHSHHSFGHDKWSGVAGLLILHFFAIFAFLFIKCNGEISNFCKIGKITLLALFSVLLVQYLFSYKAHLNNGYLGGLQPRYVLPFMFAFAIMASVFVEKYKKSFWFTVFVIVVSVHAIYSDFFYFLLYYK